MTRLITILLIAASFHTHSQEPTKKILMVVSSYGKDDGEIRPGYEFDEFAQAYLIFKMNNVTIDVASPKGGPVEADQYNVEKPYNQLVLKDEHAMQWLSNTISTSEVNADQYDAIYVVGGKGAMFDLPYDPMLQDVILAIYKKEGTILSAVCHGPAAFVHVKDGDQYIIENQKLTSFSNQEEALFGKKWVSEFPFMLQTKLEERGAAVEPGEFMLSTVHASGKFITGQNPFSTTQSAEAVITALGLTPVERKWFPDEKSIYEIQRLLEGAYSQKEFSNSLKSDLESYDIPLIAIYGYYTINNANGNEQKLLHGLSLIELSNPYFFNENLQMLAAKTYQQLDQNLKARKVLNELIEKEFFVEQAKEMLDQLN